MRVLLPAGGPPGRVSRRRGDARVLASRGRDGPRALVRTVIQAHLKRLLAAGPGASTRGLPPHMEGGDHATVVAEPHAPCEILCRVELHVALLPQLQAGDVALARDAGDDTAACR